MKFNRRLKLKLRNMVFNIRRVTAMECKKPKEQPYMPFLDQLPQLLADLERRANDPKEKSVIEIGLTNFPNQSDLNPHSFD